MTVMQDVFDPAFDLETKVSDDLGALKKDALVSYLHAEEAQRYGVLKEEIDRLGGSHLTVQHCAIGCGVGLVGFLGQYALQEIFYEQVKGFSKYLDGFRSPTHPIDAEGIRVFAGNGLPVDYHRNLFHDVFTFGSENPFYFNAANMPIGVPAVILQTFIHLLSDSMTKRGLPMPGMGNMPADFRMDLLREHRGFVDDLLSVNIGDFAGFGLAKFGSDFVAKRFSIEKGSIAYHQLKTITYGSLCLFSVIAGLPNPVSLGLTCWHGIKSIWTSTKLTRRIVEQSDLVLAAAHRLDEKIGSTMTEADWASDIISQSATVPNLDSELERQDIITQGLKTKFSFTKKGK